MGIALLSRLPGLVVENDFLPPSLRQGRNKRSMVDGLIRQSCVSIEASIRCSPCLLSTFTISGRNGLRRLEHSRSEASQAAFRAIATSEPYLRFRPRRLPAVNHLTRFKSRIAALRCNPVTRVNSSRKPAQPSGRPHRPKPPISLPSSLEPTCHHPTLILSRLLS